MEIYSDKFYSFFKTSACKHYLFYGSNEGLCSEITDNMSKELKNANFSISDFDMQQILDEPSKMLDEANSISFFGDKKLIRIFNATNKFSKFLKEFISTYNGENIILICAKDLKKTDSLPTLYREEKDSVCVPCYEDTPQTISNIIRLKLQENGKNIDAKTLGFICDIAPSDRKILSSEIEKLILYLGEKQNVEIEDIQNSFGDLADFSIEDLSYNIAKGLPQKALRAFEKLLSEGENSVTILRSISNFFNKIYTDKIKIENGQPFSKVHFKRTEDFNQILKMWQTPLLAKIINRTLIAEKNLKSTDNPANLIAEKIILDISLFAKKLRGNNG